jgi:MoaA/NifB/PqqE/SkfB family radical SAM enzyme
MLKEVKIEITDACYHNCEHCSSKACNILDKCKYMDKGLIKDLIRQAHDLGATSIVFTGGEATLHSDLSELVECAKNMYHMRTKLYTMCYRNDKNIDLLVHLNHIGLE